MLLAVYLDAVLPDANGVRQAPWFFLLPSYWRRSTGVSFALREALLGRLQWPANQSPL
jgi:hypothetical protein